MKAKAKSWTSRIQSYFITGFFAVLPILLTVFIMKWIAGTLNLYIGSFVSLGVTTAQFQVGEPIAVT